MNKNKTRLKAFAYLSQFGNKIREKFSNICGKTGQYGVPTELFQKRTTRSNRVLMPWRTVKNNALTIEQLNTFEGGVVVEFLNDDYFNFENYTDDTFLKLINKIGSDENVSAIISIRSEGGSSSSAIQREAFNKLINNTIVKYKDKDIMITKDNYQDYALKQLCSGGKGNEKWDGFLFISIRGGQQDTLETHHGQELTLFNPSCEYAGKEVILDIDLVVAYFAMLSIDLTKLTSKDKLDEYHNLLQDIILCLASSQYDYSLYSGSLLEYCVNHPSVKMIENQLTDPIQLKRIKIEDFNFENRTPDSIDFTHSEAVNLERYYWDKIRNCVLTPARPTNIFWSFHLSNMMQQDFTLDEYFNYEKERFMKRQELLNQK